MALRKCRACDSWVLPDARACPTCGLASPVQSPAKSRDLREVIQSSAAAALGVVGLMAGWYLGRKHSSGDAVLDSIWGLVGLVAGWLAGDLLSGVLDRKPAVGEMVVHFAAKPGITETGSIAPAPPERKQTAEPERVSKWDQAAEPEVAPKPQFVAEVQNGGEPESDPEPQRAPEPSVAPLLPTERAVVAHEELALSNGVAPPEVEDIRPVVRDRVESIHVAHGDVDNEEDDEEASPVAAVQRRRRRLV
jgi:hypothetical protein